MHKLSFSLPVTILREGNDYVAYTPALDISTVGKTFEDAKRMFEEAVNIFIEEINEKGTLEEVLLDLGWEKIGEELRPPTVVAHETEDFTVNTPFAYA